MLVLFLRMRKEPNDRAAVLTPVREEAGVVTASSWMDSRPAAEHAAGGKVPLLLLETMNLLTVKTRCHSGASSVFGERSSRSSCDNSRGCSLFTLT